MSRRVKTPLPAGVFKVSGEVDPQKLDAYVKALKNSSKVSIIPAQKSPKRSRLCMKNQPSMPKLKNTV